MAYQNRKMTDTGSSRKNEKTTKSSGSSGSTRQNGNYARYQQQKKQQGGNKTGQSARNGAKREPEKRATTAPSYEQELDDALTGAMQRSAVRNLENATANLQSLSGVKGPRTYKQMQQYNNALREYQQAFQASMDNGVFQTRDHNERGRLNMQNIRLKRELRQNDELLKLSKTDYYNQYYYPARYSGKSRADIESALRKLGGDEEYYDQVIKEFQKRGLNPSQVRFGNIDLNNRAVLNWNDENLKKYGHALLSWGENPADIKGSVSTVFGSADKFDGVMIAYSPMLQTENGAELLDRDTVMRYINALVKRAGEGWTTEKLYELDSRGMDINGKHIKGLVADVGDTAISTSENMHYLGKDGAYSQAQKALKANKAEYDWLSEHQYDYWSPDELAAGIRDAQAQADKAKNAQKHYSSYSYRYRNADWETKANSAARRQKAAQEQLDRMSAVLDKNAHEEELAKLSEEDRQALYDYASTRLEMDYTPDATKLVKGVWAAVTGKEDPYAAANTAEDRLMALGYGRKEAQSLLDYVSRNYNRLQRQQEMEKIADWTGQNFGTKALGSALSVPLNLAGGISGYTDLVVQNAFAGTDPLTGNRKMIDPYSAHTIASDASSTIRGTVGQGLGGVGNFLYQTGMSMADFLAAAPTGKAATVLLGGSAAMQATRDAYARGASDRQALAVGGLAGVAEATFEKLSLGNLRALQSSAQVAKRTFKQILKETAIQSGVEGSEEVFTTLANTLTDQMIMGDKNQIQTAIREYMAQGMSEEQATRKAYTDWWVGLAQDFAGGALSGGVIGGVSSGIGNASIDYGNWKTGSRIREAGNLQTLVDQGLAAPEGSATYLAAQRAQNANEGSNRQARYAGEVYQEMRQADLHDAVQARLEQLGAQDAQATADAVIAKLQQQRLTRQQEQLADTKSAKRVMNELQDAQNGIEGSNDWASGIMLKGLVRDMQLFQPNDVEEDEDSGAKAFAERYGKQADAVETVRKMQPELDAETFQAQFENAHMLGREGAAMETVNNTTATSKLTQEQRETAWQMGRAAAEADINIMEGENENGGEVRLREGSERNDGSRAAESVRGMAEGTEPAKGYPATVARSAKDEGAADVQYQGEAVTTQQLGIAEGTSHRNLYIPEESSYTPAMKEAVRIAEEHGRKIVLFGGGNLEVREGGYVVDARGMYDEATNTMYVRADHPDFTADQIARHENGHGMIENGEVSVDELKQQTAETLTPEELDKALQDYADLYDGIDITADQLWEEIVCDALGNMNVFDEIDVFKEQAQRAERTMPAIRSAVQEQQKGRAPPEKAGAKSDSVRFSMETPVEKTDRLIAWHNMGVDALNGALELGGLAMPSWAIQPANKAHTQYGDVSVIAPRELVDPKRNRNSMIFGGDAWTPVFPEVNYKVSYEAAEALEDEIKTLVGEDVFRQIGGAALDKDNIADQFKRSNGRLSGHYANNLLLKYAYLRSTGSNVEAPQREENLYYGGDFTNEDVQRFAGRLTDGKRTLEKLENMSVDELFEQDDLLQTIADIRRESYREKLKGRQDLLEKFEKSNLFSKNDIKYSTIDRMLKAARKYLDGGVQQTVDKKALQEIIDREVDQSAYEEWILQKLSDTVERKGIRNNKDLFTSSGNRRSFDQLNYAYTLANIVKAMKAQPKQGRAQFLSGPGSVRGAAMKSYKDVEQARTEIGRVIDSEDDSGAVDAAFDSYNENLSDILDRMAKNGDKFDAANAVIEILQHAKTESGIYNYMQRELKDWYNVSPELAHDIYELIGQVNALPIPYFEGKTYDAVRFDDVLAVVVPDTISEDLKNRLEDTGARVLEYKKNDEADRLRVVNSVEGAAFSRDIESISELRRENRELRERLERAKAQTRRTTEAAPREADVRKAARGVIKSAESKADLAEVTADMQELAVYMMNGEGKGKQREAASWTAVKERAVEIARDIVDNAKVLREGSDPELYKNMRQYVRGTKMTLAAEDRADMQDGYSEFVKKNMGTLQLGNDGVPVDTAYQEMQDEFGKGFFPDDITHPADQLQRIADVVNGLKPIYEAPSGRYYNEAVEWTANAIIDELLSEDVRQEAPTYADRAAAKLDARVAAERDRADARVAAEREKAEARRKAYMERSNAALQRVREQRDRRIAEIKQHNREVNERRKERSARTALWHKILDLKKDFRQMVERPQQADSKHAPMRLARALDGVTSCFNVEDRQRVLPVSELDRALGKLRDVYKLAKKDDELAMYYDAGLIKSIDNVRTMLNDVDPFDPTLDSKKLQNVYDLLRMCKHNVTTANKFATRNWAKTIIEAGRKWAAEIASASIIFKKGFGGQLLNYQLRPDSMFARFSGFAKNSVGEQVQEMFVDGTEKMLRIQQDFYYHFERFSTSEEFDRLTRRGKGSLVDVGLKDENGNTIKLTRDQMLALYMNLRSEDNLLAVAYGGVDVPSNSAYYTGKVAKSFDDSVRSMSIDANVFRLIEEARNLADEAQGEITEERRQEIEQRLGELQNEVKALEQEAFTNLFSIRAKIEKQLTKFEKDLVEAADKWMQKSKDYINAETKTMYGIEKAQVEHYWPIHRNMNFVNTDMRTADNEINLENWGSLKERVRSHDPVKLTGFVFELDNHTQKMSQFCGFAAAQRDFNKLYQTRMSYQHSTLKDQISKKFGSDSGVIGVSGMEYIDNYIAAVSGATNKEKPSLFALARRNLPRATLSANFRVALSQVASVPTAAAEVGWGAMAKGFARYSFKGFSAKQIEALEKADPWFWQRSRGDGGMREFAESKDSTFALDRAYNKVAGTKVGKALLNWCQKFDMYATFTQWAMAEEWVKSNRKDLKQGTDAFNEAVSHKYRDILRKTQPNYTVTERSDLLRDNREAMKWATMYKTQSSQNLNILYDATARLRQYTRDFKNGRNGVTQEDLTEARRQFARAYTGVILGGTVTFVLFRAFANALMHAMNPYRDDDDELHTEGVIKGLISETLGAMAGMFLLGSEIEEFIYAAVTGGKYWGLSDSAISSVSDVLSDAYKITQDPSRDNILRLVNSLSAPLGLPVDNVKRIFNGIRYHIEDIQNGEFLSFEAGVDRTTAQQLNRFIGAYRNDDSKKMQRVYDEMVRNGKAKDPEASAQSAIRKRLKSAYLGDEEGVTISDKQALRLLMQYGGKSKDDAKDLLNEWKFEKAYGFKYDDLKDAYLDGKITEKDYVSARVTYGGKSEEDAKKDAQKLRCQIDYGVEYGEQSIIDAAIGGDITVDEAKSIWMEYGGVSEKEATSRADHLQFVLDHPGTAYEDVSSKAVEGYNNYGVSANIPAEDFMEYFTDMDSFMADYDENGNLVKDSKKQKVVNYINALNISNEQKTAMYLAYGYSAKKVPAWT